MHAAIFFSLLTDIYWLPRESGNPRTCWPGSVSALDSSDKIFALVSGHEGLSVTDGLDVDGWMDG